VLVEHTDGSSTLARSLDGSSLPFDHSLYDLGKVNSSINEANRESTFKSVPQL